QQQREEHAASATAATDTEHPPPQPAPPPPPPQQQQQRGGGRAWQREAPPSSTSPAQQLPLFHANDGGFHVFPCRPHDVQVRYRGNIQDLEGGGSSGIKAESLRELLGAIEAGKRDQPGGPPVGRA
ncbi:unnamed protein product, partial [Ectocarpus fasciculatus]